MALDFNDPDLNDEKLNPEGEKLASEEIAEDAMNALRFLPAEVTSTVESTLARAYDVDAEELAELLFPES